MYYTHDESPSVPLMEHLHHLLYEELWQHHHEHHLFEDGCFHEQQLQLRCYVGLERVLERQLVQPLELEWQQQCRHRLIMMG